MRSCSIIIIPGDNIGPDAAAQTLVQNPAHYDVLVIENLLGDISSDLGGGTIGGLGMCPAGNIGDEYSYFEPIHGSAPDIAGKGIRQPVESDFIECDASQTHRRGRRRPANRKFRMESA